MTARPGSPGRGPPSYQPARPRLGTRMAPPRPVPTASTTVSTRASGMAIRSGTAGRTPPARSSRSLPRTPARPALATTGRNPRLARTPSVRGDWLRARRGGRRASPPISAPIHSTAPAAISAGRTTASASPSRLRRGGWSAAGTAARRARVQHAAHGTRPPAPPAAPPATARRRRRPCHPGPCRERPTGAATASCTTTKRVCSPALPTAYAVEAVPAEAVTPFWLISGIFEPGFEAGQVVGAGVGGLVAGVLAVADRAPRPAAERHGHRAQLGRRVHRPHRRPCRARACRRGRRGIAARSRCPSRPRSCSCRRRPDSLGRRAHFLAAGAEGHRDGARTARPWARRPCRSSTPFNVAAGPLPPLTVSSAVGPAGQRVQKADLRGRRGLTGARQRK